MHSQNTKFGELLAERKRKQQREKRFISRAVVREVTSEKNRFSRIAIWSGIAALFLLLIFSNFR